MTDYGFGDDDDDRPAGTTVKLPPPKARHPKPEREAITNAARAGADLGFVPRDPVGTTQTPTPRRKRRRSEPQEQLHISGPKRVFDGFRNFCDERELPYWQGLERLLSRNDQSGGSGES